MGISYEAFPCLKGNYQKEKRQLTKEFGYQRHIFVSPAATVNRLGTKVPIPKDFFHLAPIGCLQKKEIKKPRTLGLPLKKGLETMDHLPWVVRLHPQGLPHAADVLLQGRAGSCWKGRTAGSLEVAGVFRCVITQVVLVKLQNSWNKTTADITPGWGRGRERWRAGHRLLWQARRPTRSRRKKGEEILKPEVERGLSEVCSVPISTASPIKFGAWNRGIQHKSSAFEDVFRSSWNADDFMCILK